MCEVGRKGRAFGSIFAGELTARSQTDSWMSNDSEIAGEVGGRARCGREREKWKAVTKTIVRLSHFFGLQGKSGDNGGAGKKLRNGTVAQNSCGANSFCGSVSNDYLLEKYLGHHIDSHLRINI